jgi:hypothetical protein
MEWHLAHTVIAAFFVLLGLLMDLQSFLAGIRFLKVGRGPKPLLYIPAIAYALAALAWDAELAAKAMAFGVGVLVHLVCTIGVRALRRQ